MTEALPVLRRVGSGWIHWCPACLQAHRLPDNWQFNGDLFKPTFTPSFKHGGKRIEVKNGIWTGEWVRDEAGQLVDGTCHYIVTDGQLHYCADSWHKRTDVVDLEPIGNFIEGTTY